MSVRVWSLLWDVDIRPPSRKLVALAYADAAKDDGSNVFPGEERVARMTGLSDRQVREHLAGLIGAGLVVVVRHSAPKRNAVYRFDLDAIRTAAANRQRSPAVDRQRWAEHRRSSVGTPAVQRGNTGGVPPAHPSYNRPTQSQNRDDDFAEDQTPNGNYLPERAVALADKHGVHRSALYDAIDRRNGDGPRVVLTILERMALLGDPPENPTGYFRTSIANEGGA